MIARKSHGSSAKICNPSLHTSETPEYPHLAGNGYQRLPIRTPNQFRFPVRSGHGVLVGAKGSNRPESEIPTQS